MNNEFQEQLGPQDFADIITGSAESQRQALDIVAGFEAGKNYGLGSWDARNVESNAREHMIGTSLEYRKGWAIGQAMGAVQRKSEGKIKFSMG